MADEDRPKDAPSPTAPAAKGEDASEPRRTPSWVTEDPFPSRRAPARPDSPGEERPSSSKVTLDPSLQAELSSLGGRGGADGPDPSSSRPAGTPPRERSSASPRAPAGDQPPGAQAAPEGKRYLGLPLWGWPVVAAAGLGLLFLVADLRNRSRFIIVCEAHRVELHQGRRLPFPFGREPVGGPEYRPIAIPAEADCRQQSFSTEEEAARAFLDLLLGQVRNALSNPGGSNLGQARQQLQQALLLTRTYRGRRKEAESMLAELSYRDGRAGLARAENELRLALSRFQEAQKLDARRFDDLEEWIAHLEEMLRSIAPAPFAPAAPSPGLSPSRGPAPGPGSRPALPPASAPTRAPLPAAPPPVDAGAPPGGGSGILM